jgi:hypothetical protein
MGPLCYLSTDWEGVASGARHAEGGAAAEAAEGGRGGRTS